MRAENYCRFIQHYTVAKAILMMHKVLERDRPPQSAGFLSLVKLPACTEAQSRNACCPSFVKASFYLLQHEERPCPEVTNLHIPTNSNVKPNTSNKVTKSAVSADEAEARAWATVNKQTGGGERRGGSGRTKNETAKRADRKDSAHRAAQARSGESPNNGSARSSRSGSSSLSELTRAELIQKARERDVRGR